MKKAVSILLLLLSLFATQTFAKKLDGKKLFQEYCWGCHHQTAQAFGPSFRSIANKRDKAQIIAQIADPNGTYKSLGYKINSMPAFDDLNSQELEALADYIYKFKDKK